MENTEQTIPLPPSIATNKKDYPAKRGDKRRHGSSRSEDVNHDAKQDQGRKTSQHREDAEQSSDHLSNGKPVWDSYGCNVQVMLTGNTPDMRNVKIDAPDFKPGSDIVGRVQIFRTSDRPYGPVTIKVTPRDGQPAGMMAVRDKRPNERSPGWIYEMKVDRAHIELVKLLAEDEKRQAA